MSGCTGFVGAWPSVASNGCRRSDTAARCVRWSMSSKKKVTKNDHKKERLSVKGFGGASLKRKSTDEEGFKLIRDPKIDELYRWLRQGGAQFSRVALGEKHNQRGLYALEVIEEGEVICSVPKTLALVIGKQNTDPTKPGAELLQVATGSSSNAEFYKPLIDALPRPSDCNSAIFFSTEDLAELEYPEMLREVKRRNEQIRLAAEELFETKAATAGVDAPTDEILYDEQGLRWAVFIIVSRAFGVQNLERDFVNLLIPLVDMLNHDSRSPHQLKAKGDRFIIIAGSKIEVGEEVHVAYGAGKLKNYELFLDYGFIEYNNPNDVRGLIGGTEDLSNLREGGEKALIESLSARLDRLIPYTDSDKQTLAEPNGHSTQALIKAQFRTVHRQALAEAMANIREKFPTLE